MRSYARDAGDDRRVWAGVSGDERGGRATRRAHAAYYLRLAEAAEPHVGRSSRKSVWLARLGARA